MSLQQDLEYYLGYKPSHDLILEAQDWQDYNPGSNLSEWVDAMREIGAV
jgi:hypothetical protein